jgi:hypothetical protein
MFVEEAPCLSKIDDINVIEVIIDAIIAANFETAPVDSLTGQQGNNPNFEFLNLCRRAAP